MLVIKVCNDSFKHFYKSMILYSGPRCRHHDHDRQSVNLVCHFGLFHTPILHSFYIKQLLSLLIFLDGCKKIKIQNKILIYNNQNYNSQEIHHHLNSLTLLLMYQLKMDYLQEYVDCCGTFVFFYLLRQSVPSLLLFFIHITITNKIFT